LSYGGPLVAGPVSRPAVTTLAHALNGDCGHSPTEPGLRFRGRPRQDGRSHTPGRKPR